MIRDAQTKYVIDTSSDGPAFARFYASNMEQEGKRFRYEADRLSTLIAATVARGRGEVRFARGEQYLLNPGVDRLGRKAFAKPLT